MSEIEVMQALASAIEVPVDRARTEAVLSAMAPVLTEWSINAGDDPRGALRFGSWTSRPEVAGEIMRAQGQKACLALHEQVPHQDMVGLGWAFAAQAGPRFRWWQLARPGAGEALAQAAAEARPELAEPRALLAEACGHDARCTAVGAESETEDERERDGAALLRTTLYYEVLSPAAAVRLLEIIGCAPSLPANLFFKALLGLEPGRAAPWPKVWVGRSIDLRSGLGSGWKLYYFARGDEARRSDHVLLDLVGASPALVRACDDMRRVLAGDQALDVVQLLGLTFPDRGGPDTAAEATPRWTVYLAPR